VFRVAGMVGVLRAEETSFKGSEEDRRRDRRKREREKRERKRIYLFLFPIKIPIRTLSFAL